MTAIPSPPPPPPPTRIYGLLAEFDAPERLLAAADAARREGYRRTDAYTPFPVHGLSAALGARDTRLGWIVLAGALLGCVGGFFLQWYSSVIHYPVNVGGRPFNSWPAFMIITFELTILLGVLSAVVGMLALNGLPRYHHPLFNVPEFELASRTHFFLCIEARDPLFDLDRTTAFLRDAGASRVVAVPYESLVPPASPATPPPPEQTRHGHGPDAPPPAPGHTPLLLALCCLLLVACDNVNRGMDNEARLEPYEPSPFFPNLQSARPLVEGAVPRGHTRADEHLNAGTVNGAPAETFPFPITREVLLRGRERYNIFCAVCHNETGDGQGMIVLRGFVPPPSFHIDRLRQAPVGHFFQVITSGWGAMYSYSDRIGVEDRWAIVAYIRALQLSQGADPADLPEHDRRLAEEAAP